MKYIKTINTRLVCLFTILVSFQLLAVETLDSHEHGSANLDIAIDNNMVVIRFESPAVNIIGFEYHPNNANQKSLISAAENKLSNFATSFKLVGESNCLIVRSSADWVSEHSEHSEHLEHSEHSEHSEDEEHSDHKAITDENLETEHAEFIVEFELQCEQISNLTAIDVPLLAIFPAIEEIDVQVIYLGGQIKQELTPNNTLISLKN